MTEAEWLAAEEPQTMIVFFDDHIMELEGDMAADDPGAWWTARKMRLWAVACCRRIERLITDPRSQAGLDAVERYAEGELTNDAFRTARGVAAQVMYDFKRSPVALQHAATAIFAAMDESEIAFDTREAAGWAVNAIAAEVPDEPATGYDGYITARAAEERAQAELVREVFGNPFRPVALEPAWLTSDVRALAHAIYAERAFDRMPILADALQDAGCDNEDVLAHCRSATAPHVRGCWVIDLLLGRGPSPA